MKGKAKVDAILAKTNGLKKKIAWNQPRHPPFWQRKLFRIWWQEDIYKIIKYNSYPFYK